MKKVHLELPYELMICANLDQDNLSQEVACLLALALYRNHEISLEGAAWLSRVPLEVFIEFMERHAPVPEPDEETLAILEQQLKEVGKGNFVSLEEVQEDFQRWLHREEGHQQSHDIGP